MNYDDETLKLITAAMVKYAAAHGEVYRLLDEMSTPPIYIHQLTEEQRRERRSPIMGVFWGTYGGEQ